MLHLTLGRATGRRLKVLCIGAHCDDIEIGCGATLLTLQRAYSRCWIHWLLLTPDPIRRKKVFRSVRAFVRSSALGTVRICDLPDRLLPAQLAEVKAEFRSVY